MESYSEILNATVHSNSDTLVGRFYFDCIKNQVFKVVESQHVFTLLSTAFGCKFADKRHLILKAEKASKKESEFFFNCGYKTFLNDVSI